ncbi:hypothetical protein AKJ51_01830 [candidate division MSBL1 archaeon SCGC-AAA382A20]|uniref:Uncharacterized protein n=1 Tax=candidate division MSBL1 archaeon SCGC-AAA382A20 TaxID=1698280 RepID=A0A133VL85_9EURY|nr:hypothetical protein AKJ51_01830 [candidate division MSBL1 archaeon SCGC-AAA382A20]
MASEPVQRAEMRAEPRAELKDCIYDTGWKCPVQGDDIPLEVCKTCIKARSTASEGGLKVSRVPREEVKEAAAATVEARGESELSSEWSDLSGDSRLQKLEKAREKHMEELK